MSQKTQKRAETHCDLESLGRRINRDSHPWKARATTFKVLVVFCVTLRLLRHLR